MTRRRKQNIKLALVCAILGAIVLMTIFAPWLAPYDPLEVNMELRLLDPCRAHPLGTDDVGRDLLARLLCGGRVSLLIGLCSNGVHSNGFSLVRKIFDVEHADLKTPRDDLNGKSLGEALLAPTRIYVKAVKALLKGGVDVHAVSHITGGGFYENVPRMMTDGLTAQIHLDSFPRLPIFDLIQKTGNIPERDMYNTFNMGIGMVLALPADQAQQALEILSAAGETAYQIGEVISGEDGVVLV